MPRPLDPEDVAVLKRVFALQASGAVPGALRAAATVGDPLLNGTVLADRYLGRFHLSTPAELQDWLLRYRDLPDAPGIYALLLTKLPKGATPPPAPALDPLPSKIAWHDMADDQDTDEIRRDPVLERTIIDRAARGSAALALKQIGSRRNLPPGYAALLRANVAQQLFLRNEDEQALRVAQTALDGVTQAQQPALGGYIGGLAAWRLNRPDMAKTMFEAAATASSASPRLRAAAALWASRVARLTHDAAGTVEWLRIAAQEPTTFHGLLARRLLRLDDDTATQVISQADVDAVAATPGGRRAFALLQVAQPERAEAELRALWPAARQNPVFGRSLAMVAGAAGMNDLAVQLVDALERQQGVRPALPHFALPRLQPAGGFRVDPPLVYALARVESNFDPRAVSPVGARGLMQIMPETAEFITGNARAAARLHEPAANLMIGQRYLSSLAALDGIGDDLIRILASYNAGPGNLLRWMPAMRDQDDPLLFIETIPVAETRAFVPLALTYAWLYAAQMRLPAPSLDALAVGEFPRFTPESQERRMAQMETPAN